MIRAIVALSCVLSAAAFSMAPSRVARSSALKMAEATSPGDYFWSEGLVFDPVGFWSASNDQQKSHLALSELKNGRVAMLAVVGYIVQEIFRFPGCESFPNGIAALNSIPALGWFQIIFLIGFVDYRTDNGLPVGPLTNSIGVKKFKDEKEKTKLEGSELQHGRLAMLAIVELLRHDSELLAGRYAGDHLITGLPFLY